MYSNINININAKVGSFIIVIDETLKTYEFKTNQLSTKTYLSMQAL
jgi:hypothetical protein